MNIVKALKIHRIFVRQELKRFLEYRSDFIMGIIGFLIGQIFNLMYLWIVFANIPSLGGWSLEEVIFLYGFSLIPKGIDHLLFDNLWTVSNYTIRNGEFDKYLTRPINSLFYVLVEKFQIDALGELIMGITLICITLPKLSVEFSILKIFFSLLVIPFATLIYTGVKTITTSISFWIKRSGNITYTIYMVSDFAKYPITIYNNLIKSVITYIIPFAFTTFYPANYILTGENPFFSIGFTVVISIILMAIGVFLWNKGIKAYESSGS